MSTIFLQKFLKKQTFHETLNIHLTTVACCELFASFKAFEKSVMLNGSIKLKYDAQKKYNTCLTD